MREYEQAVQRALIDGLTGLYNHSYFLEEAQREVDRSRRYARPLALVIVDVDHFRPYNERHGYLVGDKALIAVASLIRGLLRKVDVAARFGGEEFGVLLPETGLDGAVQVAERLRIAVQAYPIAHRELQPDGVFTVSLGVAMLSPAVKTASDLLAAATAALATAKEQGRNRVHPTGDSPSSQSTAAQAGHLVEALRILDKPERVTWDYDEAADVLSITAGEPGSMASVDIGEGILLQYEEARQELVGLTLIGVRARLLQGLMAIR